MTALVFALFPIVGAARQDRRHRIIGNRWWLCIVGCAVLRVAMGDGDIIFSVLGFFGMGLPLLVSALMVEGRNGVCGGIGGGDVKLCAAVGALVGIMDALILLAVALIILCLQMSWRREKRGAFAPPFLLSYILYLGLLIFK